MSRTRLFSMAVATLFCVAPLATLAAQEVAHAVVAPASISMTAAVAETAPVVAAVPSAGPTVANAAVGVRASSAEPKPAAPKSPDVGRNPAMMIVGGVALIVGAVIGGQAGTIVMIAGAIIGLLGLYNYVQ